MGAGGHDWVPELQPGANLGPSMVHAGLAVAHCSPSSLLGLSSDVHLIPLYVIVLVRVCAAFAMRAAGVQALSP